MMDPISKLVESIKRTGEGVRQSQIRFVECVSVDWENKTMNAVGTGDGAEYIDVVLGFGYTDIKPAIGSICLIGIIEGEEVATFLINAEKVELVETKVETIVYNEGSNSGLIKVKELLNKVNALENDTNQLKAIFAAWIPVPNDGGQSLKSAISPWAGDQLKVTRQSEIEDTKIKH